MAERFQHLLARVTSHPRLCALFLGLLTATGFAPLNLWPLTIMGMMALLALLRCATSPKEAAILGWLFGWAHLTLANNWIVKAFTYQSEMPAFLGWLAVPILCLYLAIYPALAAVLAHIASRKASGDFAGGTVGFGLALAAAWIVTEWLRSWVFTGYPWPPLGLALLGGYESPGLARLLPWIGTYALSGLTIVLAAVLLKALEAQRFVLAVLGALVIALAMLAPPLAEREEGRLAYRLVQPMIPQEERDAVSKYEEHFSRLVEHTYDADNPKRVVFWPEAAVPDYLRDGYPRLYYRAQTVAADPRFARARIGQVIGPNSKLLLGVIDLEIGQRANGRIGAVGAYNAVTSMDGEGQLGARYAKSHLVPFGEYLALRWLLEPLGATRLVSGGIDFIPGPGAQTFDLGEYGKAGIQICYEIVFSGQVVDPDNRPDYIFNPSNDGWFGNWGPPQHLAQARLRAIEEGLPVIRSTTTGISAVIDARGVVRAAIPSGKADGISGKIPPAKAPTPFAQLGNLLPLGWALILALLSLIAIRRGSV